MGLRILNTNSGNNFRTQKRESPLQRARAATAEGRAGIVGRHAGTSERACARAGTALNRPRPLPLHPDPLRPSRALQVSSLPAMTPSLQTLLPGPDTYGATAAVRYREFRR